MSNLNAHAIGPPAAAVELRQMLLDLHDGPMQLVYAALLQLDLVHAALNGEGEAAHRTARVKVLLERASAELRRIIERSPAAESHGPDLLTLLREVAARHQFTTQTRVRVVAREQLPDPGPDGRHALYRILQESLSNALRHGQAGEVAVRLGLSEEDGVRRLWMSVEDNGTGFDVASVRSGETGLAGMSERMQSAGGRFAVESVPGGGTKVHAALDVRVESTP